MAGLVEPLVQTSLQACMLHQLKSFDPNLSDTTIAWKSGHPSGWSLCWLYGSQLLLDLTLELSGRSHATNRQRRAFDPQPGRGVDLHSRDHAFNHLRWAESSLRNIEEGIGRAIDSS